MTILSRVSAEWETRYRTWAGFCVYDRTEPIPYACFVFFASGAFFSPEQELTLLIGSSAVAAICRYERAPEECFWHDDSIHTPYFTPIG